MLAEDERPLAESVARERVRDADVDPGVPGARAFKPLGLRVRGAYLLAEALALRRGEAALGEVDAVGLGSPEPRLTVAIFGPVP